jgi:hypothetical protein
MAIPPIRPGLALFNYQLPDKAIVFAEHVRLPTGIMKCKKEIPAEDVPIFYILKIEITMAFLI